MELDKRAMNSSTGLQIHNAWNNMKGQNNESDPRRKICHIYKIIEVDTYKR